MFGKFATEVLMEIPLGAQVECTDGNFGRSVCLLINPLTDQVTHLVVKEDPSPNMEYIVPINLVTETKADSIRLNCSKAEIMKMDPFLQMTVIEQRAPVQSFGSGGGVSGIGSFYLPYVTTDKTIDVAVEDQQIPSGELAVSRGTRVEATDGDVGHVDEFVVNPENGKITHLVLREGHLWGKKDVIIPVSEIGKTVDNTVFVRLYKKQIEALPTYKLNRRWS